MTVSSTTTRNSYTGDGSTTVFAYTFKIFDDDDITVILRTTATGTETVQTKTTHYSVSGVGSAGGGNITFVTAPTAAQTVVLLRQTAQTQTTDYTPNDPFPAASHEDALDKMTLIIQDQQDELDRAIKLSRTNTMTSTEFTVGASDRASKVLAFDTSGELSVTQELGTFRGDWSASTAFAERDLIKDTTNNNIYLANTAHTSSGSLPISTNADSSKWDLIVDAAAATTSATNAATSATAAAASATAAAASEAAAATSETNAAASEAGVAADAAAAAASASSASTSATNAATSETNAATSASAASTSASNAATSATSASNSATSASTSASNAATSATNASNSASAASTSASNAATSETNAATSESNAATSASSAASDASAAASSAAAAAASFDAFDDIYLGAKASAPTVDNDGDALTAGDQYFNTTNSTLYVWNGSAWQSASPDIVADITPQLGGNLDTNGNDINFGDNDKAVFGTGSDLKIYHDGSNSYVQEGGTGSLYLLGQSQVVIGKSDATATYAAFNNTGSVDLYFNNAKKLATTSSGIDVTGTAVTDGLTVAGNVSVDGGTIKLDGNFPTGTENVALGNQALDDGSLSGAYNTAIGHNSLSANTTGARNTAVGRASMVSNTTGGNGVAVGFSALESNTSGNSNTAIGREALASNTTADNNTAIGYDALTLNTTGERNVAVGNFSLDANTTASENTAVGYIALGSNTTGASNTAVGRSALASNTTADNNTAVGTEALYNNTAANNTGIGRSSLYFNTSGTQNVALGRASLYNNTTASYNTAIGHSALQSNTTASDNTGIGFQSVYANTTGTGNTGLGAYSLQTNTTGNHNTAVGRTSLYLGTGGQWNTAIGRDSLYNGGAGSYNVAVGGTALYSNTTADNNTAVGYQALYANTTATSMVAVGERAGNSVTANSNSTFVGQISGRDTTGGDNTFIGQQAGYAVTTGAKNTILGRYTGNQGGLDIRTSSNYIVLSDGDGNPRQVFDSNGYALFGKTASTLSTTGVEIGSSVATGGTYFYVTRSGATAAYINRLTNDGTLVAFHQAGTEEGSISVSGTTVSYNGGHLARWSQLTDNTRDESIVKGTVMTNLDQMAEWTKDGVTEDNEQLNCMAVSSVEGDANVAGVFVNWDNDDENYTADMNIAMTGDMVIRIAQGTTVARGDLLMSAGDGTAKPQGDDIVRSKTIAKVTSTNVSHTYDDGSYLVPCVLMAC